MLAKEWIMGQVTIYLKPEIEEKLRLLTGKKGLSRSRWIAHLIQEKLNDEWPQAVIELAGAWKDLPLAEDLRKDLGKDVEREEL